VNDCLHAAITISKKGENNQLSFNRELCAKCSNYNCAKACCSGALSIGGYEISVEDLYTRINRDRQYWGAGGGITLTGGEPFAQPEFAGNFLKRCYDACIHTAVETCGNVPWENFEKVLPYLDWIFYDLKTLNESQSHLFTRPPVRLSAGPLVRSSTCPPLPQILSNARRLASEFPGRLIFRLPVIPGFNDNKDNINETTRFILATGRKEINILPLHHFGREKYNLLGIHYGMSEIEIPTKVEIQKIADQFTAMGITCYTGSETPF